MRLQELAIVIVLMNGCSAPAPENPGAAVAPAASTPSDSRPVVVTLGDSLTAGLGVDPTQNYPSRLQRRIDEGRYRYRVVNAGVSGDTSAQGLNRLSAVRELHPKIVIVALGANDGLRGMPVETTRRNLEEIVRTLKADRVIVVLAGMEMPPNYGPQYTAAFRSMFAGLAKQYRLPFVPFLLAGVGGHPGLNQDDGVHPTGEGYRIVADNVWAVLKPLL